MPARLCRGQERQERGTLPGCKRGGVSRDYGVVQGQGMIKLGVDRDNDVCKHTIKP